VGMGMNWSNGKVSRPSFFDACSLGRLEDALKSDP